MKRIFLIILKSILIILGFILVVFVSLKLIYNDDIPTGKSGPEADLLAKSMLEALHADDFKNANTISWTFRGKNSYVWKPKQYQVQISWDDQVVDLDLRNSNASEVTTDGAITIGNAKNDAIAYAIKNFNNDSFWVTAPYKVFDYGTTRSIVTENGKEKLLVQYSAGGTTPGDTYLWQLDSKNKPVNFKMWVSILPFDGLQANWINWKPSQNGALMAEKRTIFGISVPVTNLKVQ